MTEKKRRIEWRDAEVYVLRRAGKWLVGVIIQESNEGKVRAKIFKGVIKEDGSKEIVWKGKKYRISMIQRLNVPSYDYWEKLVAHVTPILKRAFKVKKGTLEEFTD